MEQSGEASQPEPPARAAQPTGRPPIDDPSSEGPDRRGFIIVGVLAFVLIAAAIAVVHQPS